MVRCNPHDVPEAHNARAYAARHAGYRRRLGRSIFKGSLLERIETVLLKDLDCLEEALLKVRNPADPPYSEKDKRSAYLRGYNNALAAALAIVREWKR